MPKKSAVSANWQSRCGCLHVAYKQTYHVQHTPMELQEMVKTGNVPEAVLQAWHWWPYQAEPGQDVFKLPRKRQAGLGSGSRRLEDSMLQTVPLAKVSKLQSSEHQHEHKYLAQISCTSTLYKQHSRRLQVGASCSHNTAIFFLLTIQDNIIPPLPSPPHILNPSAVSKPPLIHKSPPTQCS